MAANKSSLGGMIQLDGRELGTFYGSLRDGFAQFMAAYATTSMWCTKSGSGLFSPLAAQELKQMIKDKMDGKSPYPTHWDNIGVHQSKLKEAFGYFGTPWKMTGSVYQNIVATNRNGKNIVGIDRRISVPQIGFGGKKKYRSKIKVERYAAWVEFGTKNQPERPLFTPAARYFISVRIPGLLELVDKTFKNVAKRVFVSDYVGKSTGMGDASNIVGEASLRSLASSNPAADFVCSQSAVGGEIAQLVKDGKMSANGRRQSSIIFQEDKADIKKHMDKTGITLESLMADGKSESAAKEILKIMRGMGL